MDEAGEVKRVVICATTPRDDTHGVVAARPPRRKATPFSRPGDAPEAPLVTFADDAGREGQPPEVARRCKERKPTPYQRADPRIDVEVDAGGHIQSPVVGRTPSAPERAMAIGRLEFRTLGRLASTAALLQILCSTVNHPSWLTLRPDACHLL